MLVIDEIQNQITNLQRQVDELRTYELNYVSRLNVASSGAGVGQVVAAVEDAVTNSQSRVFILRHNSTGTPAANFGTQLHFEAESTTTENRDVASIGASWATATDASRLGQLQLYTRHSAGLTEGLKLQATSTTVTDVTVPNGDFYTEAFQRYDSTSTVTGWLSFTQKVIEYKKIGRFVFVNFRLAGTSNATTISFTLPHAENQTGDTRTMCLTQDNGGALETGYVTVTTSTATVTRLAGAYTNAGTKVAHGQFFYEATS